ncbi:hypothetical protein BIW11_06117, partial [Tropilaelaps mercedesae]
ATATLAQQKIAAPTGNRSLLLEAIRNHKGIVGLKAAKPERNAAKKSVASAASPMDHMDALKERLMKRRRDIAGGGRSAVSQPDVIESSRQQSEPKKAGLIMGLMDKIVTQKGGDSDSDSDQVVDEEPW